MPLAQSIIQNRQALLQTTIVVLPWFSLTSFTLGLLAVLIGGMMWLRRTQKLTDKLNELNVKLLENKLAAETPEQANEKRAEEFKAQIESEAEPVAEEQEELTEGKTIHALEPDNVSAFIQSAYDIERKLAYSLTQCFSETHEILTNRRLGAASFDIVLVAKTTFIADYLFEIKYIRKGFKYNWVRDNLLKLVYANDLYQNEIDRHSIPALVIVGPDNLSRRTRYEYLQRANEEISKLNRKALLIFLSEQELDDLDCTKLKRLLEITEHN